MRLLVCGSRLWTDRNDLFRVLDRVHAKVAVTELIQGGARGADALAADWAQARGIPCRTFDADWKQHGKRAGAIRNQQMLDEGSPDAVVAFAIDLSSSRGTADMINRARRRELPVFLTEVSRA